MRLNKKKLAALAMSAVMAASTMPFPVMAEEEFTDFAEFTDEGAATVATAEQNATSETNTTLRVDLSAELNAEGKVVATATWTVDGIKKTEVATVDKTYAPTSCTEGMKADLSKKIGDVVFTATQVTVDGTQKEHTWGEPTEKITKNPTCTKPGEKEITKKCTVCGATETKKEPIVEEHHFSITKEYVLRNNSTGNAYGEVTVDSNTIDYAKYVNVKVLRNAKGEALLDKDGNFQLDLGADGKPQADNVAANAGYYVKTTKKCTVCDYAPEAEYSEYISIGASQVTSYTVISKNNIATDEFGSDTLQKLINNDESEQGKVELKDCNKPGTIIVQNWVNGKEAGQQTVTIPAHHKLVTVYVASSTEDAALLEKVTVGNKTTIKNNSCSKEITYYEVQYCTADVSPDDRSCNLTEKFDIKKYMPIYGEKTTADTLTGTRVYNRKAVSVKPEGIHSVANDVKKAMENLVADTTGVNAVNGVLTKDGVDALVTAAKTSTNKKYVKVSENTATCTEGGTITVEFICRKCNTTAETVTLKTAKLGHDFKNLVDKATEVKATCQERGHYETADLCTRCGVESDTSVRKTYYIKRLPHTNELSVLDSGVTQAWNTDITDPDVESSIIFTGDKVIDNAGKLLKMVGKTYLVADQTAYVEAKVYTNCTKCHDNLHELVIPTITVKEIQKESATGEAGYIKLVASYTYKNTTTNKTKTVTAEHTVPYYSSVLAYQGRVEPEVINGLHTDKDGFTRYYEDGKVVETTGIIKYAGREYLVKDGVLCDSTHGVTLVGDTFYFLANGCVQRGYTGVAIYDNESFYLSNGVVDTNVNGLVPYQGGTFLFAAGRLVKEHNGLWQNSDGTWYFLALGQVQTQYTGVAEYDGAYFYVKSGKLDTTKNGTITVDGVKYTAVNGQLYK